VRAPGHSDHERPPKAQAAATRSAILDAFVEQLSDPGRTSRTDSYGLPLDRIPDVIAYTVELIIRDLRTHVTGGTPT
jgi:hypothetical protein